MATRGNMSGPAVTVSSVRTGSGTLGFGGSSIGVLQGIYIGGPTSMLGDTTFGRHLVVGVLKSTTQGSPAVPSMQLDIPNFFRFRWGVVPGVRNIQINCLQVANGTPRPTMVVRANSAVGLAVDLVGTAPSATGWTVIGPLSFTCTTAGVVYVELHNNYYGAYASPCFFDHRITF